MSGIHERENGVRENGVRVSFSVLCEVSENGVKVGFPFLARTLQRTEKLSLTPFSLPSAGKSTLTPFSGEGAI